MHDSRKTHPPMLPPLRLQRTRLSQVLEAALGSQHDTQSSPGYPLILLCAPAGMVKRRCWLTQCSAWLSLVVGTGSIVPTRMLLLF